jgi:hypothetical protein
MTTTLANFIPSTNITNLMNTFINNINNNNINIENSIATISYCYDDEEYTLKIPIITNKRLLRKMKSKKVIATYEDENGKKLKVDITQQAGMPYLITPNMLECDCVQVINLNDMPISTFIDDDIITLD